MTTTDQARAAQADRTARNILELKYSLAVIAVAALILVLQLFGWL